MFLKLLIVVVGGGVGGARGAGYRRALPRLCHARPAENVLRNR